MSSSGGRSPVVVHPVSQSGSLEEMAHNKKILQHYLNKSTKDPVASLYEYYQTKGGVQQDITAAFQEIATVEPKGPSFYRYVFSCPLSQNTVSSSLPVTILVADAEENTCHDELVTLTKQFWSDFKMVDGLVFFQTKKAAKKSCALAALIKLALIDTGDCTILAASVEEAKSILSMNSQGKANIDSQLPQPHLEKAFPKWVNQLYALGLEKITISYYEEAYAVQDWNMQPIKLCCQLSGAQPGDFVVRGPPCTTKTEAIESAIRSLEQEIMASRHPWVQETNGIATMEGCHDESCDSVRIKTALLRCEDHKVRFIHCQPSWAAAAFDVSRRTQPFGYLYELIIRTKESSTTTGPSWLVANKLGLTPSQTTRMGMLFPRDIEPYLLWTGHKHNGSAAYQADFVFRDPLSGEETAVVELKHRTVLDSMEPEELIKLSRFNRGMIRWKEYGLGKNGRSRAFLETPPARDSGTPLDGGRTYLFVPLASSNSDQDLSIHWDLIDRQLADRPMPFLDVPRSIISFLPVLGDLECENVAVTSLGVVAAILARKFLYIVHLLRGFSFTAMLESLEWIEFCILAAASLLCYSAWASTRLPPTRNFSTNELKNQFVLHRGMIYVVALNQGDQLSSHSPFPTPAPEDFERNENYKQKYGLDLFKATFADYFLLKYDNYNFSRYQVRRCSDSLTFCSLNSFQIWHSSALPH